MRKQGIGTQQRARAADRHRHHRHAGLGSSDKGPHVKRQQTRHAREGALGKKHQRAAGLDRLHGAPGIGRATLLVEALHEQGADAPQKPARNKLAVQLHFGHESELHGQGRHQHHAVQVAGMVADDHTGLPPRQLLDPLYR